MNYEDILYDLVKSDEKYMLMTAENRAVIRNITDKLGNQFLDTGITEQTMIGIAAGLGLRGRVPIVHALAAFLTMRAFEFIRTDVGILQLPVKLVGFIPGFLSEANGPTHQAIEDIALMRGIPKMDIYCPADNDDLLKGIKAVFKSPKPTYIRFNNQHPLVKHKPFKIGEPEVFGNGKDITIFTYGTLFNQAFLAREILAVKGIDCRIVNLRMLNPIDRNYIYQLSSESFFSVTLEDHFRTGGLYTVLAEVLLANNSTCPVLPLGLNEKWFKPALLNDVLKYEKLDAVSIANQLENQLQKVKNEYYTEWSSV